MLVMFKEMGEREFWIADCGLGGADNNPPSQKSQIRIPQSAFKKVVYARIIYHK